MTAIRETFEETGLLLATSSSGSPPSDAVLDAARESIHTGKTLFRDFLRRHGLVADVKALLPFTEWVTPLGARTYVRALSFPRRRSHNPHIPARTQTLPHAVLRRLSACAARVQLLLWRHAAAPPAHLGRWARSHRGAIRTYTRRPCRTLRKEDSVHAAAALYPFYDRGYRGWTRGTGTSTRACGATVGWRVWQDGRTCANW